MPVLTFPTDRIVGTLSWLGSWSVEDGPVLAVGEVEVPDDVAVDLDARAVHGKVRQGDGWQMVGVTTPANLDFLRALPADAVNSLTLGSTLPASYAAVMHLAPGLRTLHLPGPGLTDALLPYVAQLHRLTMLKTYGNAFSDEGVQVLGALTSLTHLYLEEETLSLEAFRFVEQLPALQQLGLQDVPLTVDELAVLRRRLPGVSVVQ